MPSKQEKWEISPNISWLKHHANMPSYTVKVDATKFVANVRDFEKKQLPFVMAKTLTNTVQDAQAVVKQNAARAFSLRNDWTQRGIRIKPAQKKGNEGRIEADVHTDTGNHKSGAPDYLGRQEDGGEKVPFGGHHYIAVPTDTFRKRFPGVIPAELRPRNLLSDSAQKYGRYAIKNRKGQIALRNQKIVRGYVFFIQKTKDGKMAIMGRPAAGKEAFPFYWLISRAHVKKSGLEMRDTVEKVANERFGPNWEKNWKQIYASGLKL